MKPTAYTADWHLTDNPRDEYRHEFIPWLVKFVRDAKLDTLVIAGDLTEQKDGHNAWLVNRITDYIDELSRLCNIIILQGNHDAASSSEPFFKFLRHIPNVRWIGKPAVIDDEYLYLPHTNNYKLNWKGIAFNAYKLVVCHNTFAGANLGHGFRADAIPLEVFPKGSRVVAGDVHVPQVLGPVTYIGAPYTIDFGDNYKPRILLMVDGKLTGILVPGKQKRLIDISSVEDLLYKEIRKGDICKVRVNLKQREKVDWPSIREAIMKFGEKNSLTIHQVQPVYAAKDGTVTTAKSMRSLRTDEILLRDYTKHMGIDEKLARTGQKLMEKT